MVQSLGKGSGPVRTAQVAQGALNQDVKAIVHGGSCFNHCDCKRVEVLILQKLTLGDYTLGV